MLSKFVASFILAITKLFWSTVEEKVTFTMKPFDQLGLFSQIELSYSIDNFNLNQKNLTYSMQSVLDYSNISSKILSKMSDFQASSKLNNIKGQCLKIKDGNIYECMINLNPYNSPLIKNKINYDYVLRNDIQKNKDLISSNLYQHAKILESNMYETNYIEHIRNKCFEQSSHQFLVILPISQVREQKIVDSIIQSKQPHSKTKIKIIHYIQGAKTLEEFNKIVQITITKKYPMTKQNQKDSYYIDQRSQYVTHYFLGDISMEIFDQINYEVLQDINQSIVLVQFKKNLLVGLTRCLNEQVPQYYNIVMKKEAVASNQNSIFSSQRNSIVFNSKFENKSVQHLTNNQKYIIYKKFTSNCINFNVILYIAGDAHIISTKVVKNMKNKIFRVVYKLNIPQQMEQYDQKPCNQFISVLNYQQEETAIDILFHEVGLVFKSNDEIKYEKKPYGIHKFTMKLYSQQ